MKRCRDCGQSKLLDVFVRKEGRVRAYCKPCWRVRTKAWYEANKERAAANHARWVAANPDKQREYRARRPREALLESALRWKAAHPERVAMVNRAHSHITHALRDGRLTRPSECEHCGVTARIQAAHRDYKRPLDVAWLCASCHSKWDAAEPKTVGGIIR